MALYLLCLSTLAYEGVLIWLYIVVCHIGNLRFVSDMDLYLCLPIVYGSVFVCPYLGS